MQGLERQNKPLANTMFVKKTLVSKKNVCRCINEKKSLQRRSFHTPLPPHTQENNGPSLIPLILVPRAFCSSYSVSREYTGSENCKLEKGPTDKAKDPDPGGSDQQNLGYKKLKNRKADRTVGLNYIYIFSKYFVRHGLTSSIQPYGQPFCFSVFCIPEGRSSAALLGFISPVRVSRQLFTNPMNLCFAVF